MSLDCRKKPEHPKENHTDTGRTCQFHTERIPDAPAGYSTQSYPLCHHAALLELVQANAEVSVGPFANPQGPFVFNLQHVHQSVFLGLERSCSLNNAVTVFFYQLLLKAQTATLSAQRRFKQLKGASADEC